MVQSLVEEYLEQKLMEAKQYFERAVDCKHTAFDDLYPYMLEHPQFFWYKRYVAWSQLLTIVEICRDCAYAWEVHFTHKQAQYVREKVMSANVLDHWYEAMHNGSHERVG
ncbi:MAG: hypothetical protein KGO83_06865 [Paenibacillaceae bacterium]|jgi:hypothetical protein|nr:hypothetical protein [Paenibacillaceae bacterium]